jgi:hypothetical protein
MMLRRKIIPSRNTPASMPDASNDGTASYGRLITSARMACE